MGTGSTATHFIDAIAELVRDGRRLSGVPTSEQSRLQAVAAGIPLLDEDGPWTIDVCVDGADEVSDELDLIKGGGGAHTREKIVNQASALNVIVVDESKLSRQLGEKWPVPVEVLAFAHKATARALGVLGEVTQRQKGGGPWRTDSGNYIYDVRIGPIEDPWVFDTELRSTPGVVETGLFCGRADVILVAGPGGVREVRRAE